MFGLSGAAKNGADEVAGESCELLRHGEGGEGGWGVEGREEC